MMMKLLQLQKILMSGLCKKLVSGIIHIALFLVIDLFLFSSVTFNINLMYALELSWSYNPAALFNRELFFAF